MCKIPSPSLLLAITLWKVGRALRFLSCSHACTGVPHQQCWALCTGGRFFPTFSTRRRVCSICFGNNTTSRRLHGLCKQISIKQVVCFGLTLELVWDSCLLPCFLVSCPMCLSRVLSFSLFLNIQTFKLCGTNRMLSTFPLVSTGQYFGCRAAKCVGIFHLAFLQEK